MKNYSKTKPMKYEEFAAEQAWWGDEADGLPPASRTSRLGRWHRRHHRPQLQPGYQNPHVGEQISHDPDELLARYASQQAEIQQLRDQLKEHSGCSAG